jgi:hypothetical protein
MNDVKTVEEVLGFNPKTNEPKIGWLTITPEVAKYILDNHNKDNRLITQAQTNCICKSIDSNGWQDNGEALPFNVEGNITEYQHRLEAIVIKKITVKVSYRLGVSTDCFTKTARAKPRTPVDEVQRKDKTAEKSHVTILGQVLSRRKGEKLTMQNAISQWNNWKNTIKQGNKIVEDFFDTIDNAKFTPYIRVFGAWSTLMIREGQKELAEKFLDLLSAEINQQDTSFTLTADFMELSVEAWDMSNVGRADYMYQLLCVASDKLAKDKKKNKYYKGEITIGYSPDKFTHDKLKRQGFYRKFLVAGAR